MAFAFADYADIRQSYRNLLGDDSVVDVMKSLPNPGCLEAGLTKEASPLRKYAEDWGYGVKVGSIYKKLAAVPVRDSMSLVSKEFYWSDHLDAKPPPSKPLSKDEIAGVDGQLDKEEGKSTKRDPLPEMGLPKEQKSADPLPEMGVPKKSAKKAPVEFVSAARGLNLGAGARPPVAPRAVLAKFPSPSPAKGSPQTPGSGPRIESPATRNPRRETLDPAPGTARSLALVQEGLAAATPVSGRRGGGGGGGGGDVGGGGGGWFGGLIGRAAAKAYPAFTNVASALFAERAPDSPNTEEVKKILADAFRKVGLGTPRPEAAERSKLAAQVIRNLEAEEAPVEEAPATEAITRKSLEGMSAKNVHELYTQLTGNTGKPGKPKMIEAILKKKV